MFKFILNYFFFPHPPSNREGLLDKDHPPSNSKDEEFFDFPHPPFVTEIVLTCSLDVE